MRERERGGERERERGRRERGNTWRGIGREIDGGERKGLVGVDI